MRIGLIGFGKTGKAVASVLLESNKHNLQWVLRQKASLEQRDVAEFLGIDSPHKAKVYSLEHFTVQQLLEQEPVDIIIDFSSTSGIYTYGTIAAAKGVKIISAISHYGQKELDFLDELSKTTTVFWSPNITLGVNYLMFAAKFLKKIAPWVDIEIVEEHFKGKEGVSGTAQKIAQSLDIDADKINSVRVGGIVGRHEVIFGFPYETVRLIHESIGREAFGSGVLFVADNLIHKPNGRYKFEDLLLPYFSS